MLSGHSVVNIEVAKLISPSEINDLKLEFKPHLYFILGVPRWYFKKVRCFIFDKTKVKYTVLSEDGIEYTNTFRLEDQEGNSLKVSKLEISKDSLYLIINGTEKYSATNIMLNNKNFIPAFKILYIGQSKGQIENGVLNRDAQERLKSHSTLQKILSDINDSKLTYDIKLLLFSTTEIKLVTTMDSGEYAGISAEEISDFPDESSHINLIEAKLINYFKPIYNEKYVRHHVPSESHKSYEDYFNKKFNSMVISFSNLGSCSFYSDCIENFNTTLDIIDYSIIGEDNFFKSVIEPYIN